MYNYFKIHSLVNEKSFKGFLIFSSGGHLVHPSLSNFGRGSPKEYSSDFFFFLNWASGLGGDVVLRFFLFFSSGGHFVQRSRNI